MPWDYDTKAIRFNRLIKEQEGLSSETSSCFENTKYPDLSTVLWYKLLLHYPQYFAQQ